MDISSLNVFANIAQGIESLWREKIRPKRKHSQLNPDFPKKLRIGRVIE
jgi:hypothetical protein